MRKRVTCEPCHRSTVCVCVWLMFDVCYVHTCSELSGWKQGSDGFWLWDWQTFWHWKRDWYSFTHLTIGMLKISKETDWALVSLRKYCLIVYCCMCVWVCTPLVCFHMLIFINGSAVCQGWWQSMDLFVFLKERLPWLRFPFVAVNCFWQAVQQPHTSPLTALALVNAMLHLLFISALKADFILLICQSEISEREFFSSA